MAHLAYPAVPAPTPEVVQGREAARYLGTQPLPLPQRTSQDLRIANPTTGQISDTVVLLAGGIEIPFANGRVWLLRLTDGYKAWEGWTDASGNYTATGLELGVEYVAVGIDPYRNQKATGAGPVMAT